MRIHDPMLVSLVLIFGCQNSNSAATFAGAGGANAFYATWVSNCSGTPAPNMSVVNFASNQSGSTTQTLYADTNCTTKIAAVTFEFSNVFTGQDATIPTAEDAVSSYQNVAGTPFTTAGIEALVNTMGQPCNGTAFQVGVSSDLTCRSSGTNYQIYSIQGDHLYAGLIDGIHNGTSPSTRPIALDHASYLTKLSQ